MLFKRSFSKAHFSLIPVVFPISINSNTSCFVFVKCCQQNSVIQSVSLLSYLNPSSAVFNHTSALIIHLNELHMRTRTIDIPFYVKVFIAISSYQVKIILDSGKNELSVQFQQTNQIYLHKRHHLINMFLYFEEKQ